MIAVRAEGETQCDTGGVRLLDRDPQMLGDRELRGQNPAELGPGPVGCIKI